MGLQGRFAARPARSQHVEADPPDDRRQPGAQVVDVARVGAAQADPGFLDGVVRLGHASRASDRRRRAGGSGSPRSARRASPGRSCGHVPAVGSGHVIDPRARGCVTARLRLGSAHGVRDRPRGCRGAPDRGRARERARRSGRPKPGGRPSTRSGPSCAGTMAFEPTATTSSSTTTPRGPGRRWRSTSASRSAGPSPARARSCSRTRRPGTSRRRCTSDRPSSWPAPMPPSRSGAVANHRSLAGVSWEIYGDPGDDPATFEVQVFYLLAGGGQCGRVGP